MNYFRATLIISNNFDDSAADDDTIGQTTDIFCLSRIGNPETDTNRQTADCFCLPNPAIQLRRQIFPRAGNTGDRNQINKSARSSGD